MLSAKLKELRHQKNISQAELAKHLEVAQQSVGKWEKDITRPSFEMLQKIADYFHITTDELLGRESKSGYYIDDETAEIANALKEGDGMLRVMFDAARNLPPEKMKEAASYIEYLKARQHPEDD